MQRSLLRYTHLTALLLAAVFGSVALAQAQANQAATIVYNKIDPVSTQNQIWAVRPDGTGNHLIPAPLLQATAPVFSRDGKRIAITGQTADDGASFNIYLCDTAGNHLEKVTDNQDVKDQYGNLVEHYGAEFKAFSPEGQRVVLSQYGYGPTIVRYLEVFNRDGTYISVDDRAIQGASDGCGVDWSPVADKLVVGVTGMDYSSGQPAVVTPLYLVDPVANAFAQGRYQQLTNPQSTNTWTTVNDTLPAFSPDAKQVAFIRKSATYGYNGFGPATTALMVVNTDGTNLRTIWALPQGTVISYHLSWSPDGSSLAFDMGPEVVLPSGATGIEYPSQATIGTIRPDGTGLAQMPMPQGCSPSWGPGLAATPPQLLFQNANTGQLAAWQMNGTTPNGANYITPGQDPNWKAVGTGDFNGDGQPDLLFQNAKTGQLAVWFMNGAAANGGQLLAATPPAGWKVASVDDFNGDGQPDILLQNPNTGQVALWTMNGVTAASGAFLNKTLPTGWSVVGTGDFNGDGKPDLLLQNGATGQMAVWFLNGTTVTGGAFLTPTQTAAWKCVGVLDLNGDGKPDLLFQNTTTGQLVYWLMNGTTAIDGNFVNTTPPAGWLLVGPH